METIDDMKLTKTNPQNKALRLNGELLAWAVCAVGAIFYSYEYLLRITPSVMAANLMEHFNIHATGFGTLSAFYYYAYVPMQIPVGMLMDRFGPRRLLTLACAFCVLGTYLFVATPYYSVSALGRFLVGFGSAFAFVGVLKLATIWLPPNRFAMFAGLASALGTVGAIFGDITMTSLVNSVGWQQTVYISAIAGIFITALIWLVVRDESEISHVVTELGEVGGMRQVMTDTAKIFKNPSIWINGMVGCLIYLPTTTFAELWGIPYLRSAYFFSPEEAAFGVSALFFGFTVGAPIAGWFSDYIGKRRLPLIIGALCAAVLMTAIIYIPNLSTTAVFTLLFLLGMSYGAQAIVFAVAREISPEDVAGTAIAVTNMIVMLGGLLLQTVVGMLLDLRWGGDIANIALHIYSTVDYQFALSVIPIGILLSAILAFFIQEKNNIASNNR